MTKQTKSKLMKLNFPNQSRSYDSTRKRICFWGYDRTIEVSFYVEGCALHKLNPEMTDAEAGFLEAFDAARDRIQAVADKVYACRHEGSFAFTLYAEDF